jgi:hypothetical protein
MKKYVDRAKLKQRESNLLKPDYSKELALNKSIADALESVDPDNLESVIQSIAAQHGVHIEVVLERMEIFLQ